MVHISSTTTAKSFSLILKTVTNEQKCLLMSCTRILFKQSNIFSDDVLRDLCCKYCKVYLFYFSTRSNLSLFCIKLHNFYSLLNVGSKYKLQFLLFCYFSEFPGIYLLCPLDMGYIFDVTLSHGVFFSV